MTPPQIQLRRAAASDLDAIVALERATENAPHWPPATYAAIFDFASPRCLIVAHTNESLAGFAVGLMHPLPLESTDRSAELESVVVSANSRRAGIGRALCAAAIDWCSSQGATEVILEVRAASAGAIALYTALGFTQNGHRPRYYRNPDDDARMMSLRLNPSVSGRGSL
jgi:ribosomal-protein-alanine N-acetyltransferase